MIAEWCWSGLQLVEEWAFSPTLCPKSGSAVNGYIKLADSFQINKQYTAIVDKNVKFFIK